MNNLRFPRRWRYALIVAAALTGALCSSVIARGQEQETVKAERLLKAGTSLADQTHYLEALDLLDEARTLLEKVGDAKSAPYADVLFALAQAKIKGRLHQGFPSGYVKAARDDIQTANRLREKLPRVLPQKLAEGLYLEGYVLQRFFRQADEARSCFSRCVEVDPGHAACKRELSAVLPGKEDGRSPKDTEPDPSKE
ncbi:MAG: hypothetical protein AB1646_04160 [Thermodesulfobacteriota bacterium]